MNEVTARRAQLEQAISRVCSVFLELKIVLKATSKEKVQQSADAFREWKVHVDKVFFDL